MHGLGEKILLRMYLRSTDQYHLAPAYERIVLDASRHKLAGATVLRGTMGFGSRGITEASPWHLGSPTPVIVEIVDAAEPIESFVVKILPPIMRHGLITMERAGVMMYRHRAATDAPPPLRQMETIQPLSTVPTITTGANVKTNQDQVLLRIFIGESDEFEGTPLPAAIIQKARHLGLAGGTVLKGSMGFGANSVLHTNKILALSSDLPIVIELVDSQEKIDLLLPFLDAMVREGMITMEHVRVIMYRHNATGASATP